MKTLTLLTFLICALYTIELFIALSTDEMRANLPINAILLIACSVMMYQASFGAQAFKLKMRKRSKYASVVLMLVNFIDGLSHFYNWYNSYAMIFRYILIHVLYMAFYVLSDLWCQEIIE